MSKLWMVLASVLLLAAGTFSFPEFADVEEHQKYLTFKKIEDLSPVAVPHVTRPDRQPRRDDIIGERVQVGDTWYDYQSNGSIGKMIAIDNNGGIHITWMDGLSENIFQGERVQKYNYSADGENWINLDGESVSQNDRSGYGALCLSSDDVERAIVFYHGKDDNNEWRGYSGIDFLQGIGAFTLAPLPRFPELTAYFPQGVMSPDGLVHVAMQRYDREMISYARGRVINDTEFEYLENPFQVGQTHRTDFRIAASPNSERTAIVYLHSRAGVPRSDGWDYGYATNNDLMLVWTEDGENWNFEEPFNVTHNPPPNPDLEGDAAFGDTLRPYANFDVIFDSDDNIHIVFDARGLWVKPEWAEGELAVEALTSEASMLFHWSEETDHITPVAEGWFSHRQEDENGETTRWPIPGAWKSNVCAPSLGYDGNGDLYCVFNYFPEDDYSVHDYCNGDIAVTVSEDNGETWYMPTMITETHTLEAEEGESECEIYPSLAERVDDFLHISYELDTEPGTPVEDFNNRTEIATLCPWHYHKVPVEEVNREELYEDGPTWHAEYPQVNIADVMRDPGVPVTDGEVTVSAIVQALGDDGIGNVWLEYQVGGAEGELESVDMENLNDDSWSGVLPAQDEGTIVWYRVRAQEENDGDELINPAGMWYSYVVRNEGELTVHDVQYYHEEWNKDWSPYMGYEVTLHGVLTTDSEFNANYGAYAMQEEIGFWNGIFLRDIEDDLQLGDSIRVTGFVRERDPESGGMWTYQTYIEVSDFEVLENDAPVHALAVDLIDLQPGTTAEALEGVLISTALIEFGVHGTNDLSLRYIPIIAEEDESWMTLYGLSEDLREEMITETRQGTTIDLLTGIFAENQRYAIAPRNENDMFGLGIRSEESNQPLHFEVVSVYPNPFNSSTTIEFNLAKSVHTEITIHDMSGRQVAILENSEIPAGRNLVTWNADSFAAGIYFVQLKTAQHRQIRKVVLMR